ncbi:transposase [Geobacter sp. AOG2]|uniref:REP-associated tyrosine transposase n=1 Tax=Geobacter sp. AOG2 TaxID=1566347 RepID=UPI001CC346A9|nr:transposase [Geobacter sp. AOG2]GFE59542.1 transposase [Geobacter sp. AOG2]
MARPLRIEYPGAFYHVTSRGNEQKDVFKNQRDRERFLVYLASATERYGAVIHAYCLMGNHYHLLLETPGGNLSQIMRHINGAYTTYFNVKRKRAGHLFQGRYKAILVEADDYAAELSRYIHLNPVRVGIVERPEHYQWSSYRNYCGESEPPEWLKTGFILGCFGKKSADAHKKYRAFVEDRLGKEYESPLRRAIGASILGSPAFVEEIAATHLKGKEDRNIPVLRQFAMRPTPEQIIEDVEAEFGEDIKLARRASIHLCHKYSGMRLKELGECFNVRDTGISEASRRFARELEEDRKLMEVVERIKGKLKNV